MKSALFVSMERDRKHKNARSGAFEGRMTVQASSDDEEGTLQDLFVTLLLWMLVLTSNYNEATLSTFLQLTEGRPPGQWRH